MVTIMEDTWYQKYPYDPVFCILFFSHKRQRLELRWARELEELGILNFHPRSVMHLAVQLMLKSPSLENGFPQLF